MKLGNSSYVQKSQTQKYLAIFIVCNIVIDQRWNIGDQSHPKYFSVKEQESQKDKKFSPIYILNERNGYRL